MTLSNYIAIRYHLSTSISSPNNYQFSKKNPSQNFQVRIYQWGNPASDRVNRESFIMLQGAGVSRIAGIAAPPGRPLRFSSSSSSAEGNTPDLSKQRLLEKTTELWASCWEGHAWCKWCWGWKGLWKKHQEVYERFINRLLLVSSSNWYLHLFITYLHILYFHYTPSTTSPIFCSSQGTGRWLLLSRLHALYVGPSIDLPPPWHWPRGGRRSPRRPGGHPGDISKSLGVENIEGWFFKVPFLNPIWK